MHLGCARCSLTPGHCLGTLEPGMGTSEVGDSSACRDKGCDPGVQPRVVLASPSHQDASIPACLKINFHD